MRGYPQFSFSISITLVKICFSHIFNKRKKKKKTIELGANHLTLEGGRTGAGGDLQKKIPASACWKKKMHAAQMK